MSNHDSSVCRLFDLRKRFSGTTFASSFVQQQRNTIVFRKHKATMSRLFEPVRVGAIELDHRIAMAPLTRYRMDDNWEATPMSQGVYTTVKSHDSRRPFANCFQNTMSSGHVPKALSSSARPQSFQRVLQALTMFPESGRRNKLLLGKKSQELSTIRAAISTVSYGIKAELLTQKFFDLMEVDSCLPVLSPSSRETRRLRR